MMPFTVAAGPHHRTAVAGRGPATYGLGTQREDVDGRATPGHGGRCARANP
jgi:hypothetical protein